MIGYFIKERIGWLWRIPVNIITLSIGAIPEWLVILVSLVLICDIIVLCIHLYDEVTT